MRLSAHGVGAQRPGTSARSATSSQAGGRVRVGARRLGAVLLTAFVSACGGPHASPPTTHRIAIRGFLFDPAEVVVAVGDTVIWMNEDLLPHTATSAAGGWDTGSIATGDSAIVVMDRLGVNSYLCTFHPNMVGEVVVAVSRTGGGD